MAKLLQNSGTRLPQLMNTSGFHQNVGEGNKSFNAMSPDPYLSEAFGKGSGCARLVVSGVVHSAETNRRRCRLYRKILDFYLKRKAFLEKAVIELSRM